MNPDFSAIFDNSNYREWRNIHGRTFGPIFTNAFKENPEAQVHLTAVLIDISQKRFKQAMPKLELLYDLCRHEFDIAATHYFTGLNYEFLGDETNMSAHYEELRTSDVKVEIPLLFHPYYRTAKMAQKDAECSKAIYYYGKALEFFYDAEPTAQNTDTASYIIYDMATAYMYMHEYEHAARCLELSHEYSKAQNQHRDYVCAILHAIHGRKAECRALLTGMSELLRQNCQLKTSAILSGADPHYCVVPQNRSRYALFFNIDTEQRKTVA